MRPAIWTWVLAAACSGAVALGYEMVWMRRLALMVGGSALASAVTVGGFMAGLAIGAWAVARVAGPAGRVWAGAELLAAAWALLAPSLHAWAWEAGLEAPAARLALAAALVAWPAVPLGATWPALARAFDARDLALLYTANTAGAVLGVLGTVGVLLPSFGLLVTERLVACAGLALAWGVRELDGEVGQRASGPTAPGLLGAVALAGAVSMGLELVWFRLAAVAFGGTVQVHGLVLAVFLATVAAGAALGRVWPAAPRDGVVGGLAALGGLSLLGTLAWARLPYWVAGLYAIGGPDVLLPGTAALALAAMGGAPAASGFVFTAAVRAADGGLARAAPGLYAANTVGCIVGTWGVALLALPHLGPGGTVALGAVLSAGGAILLGGRAVGGAVVLAAWLVPDWDARLYAVGVHLRLREFADTSATAVRRFADEGWELVSYEHGATGAVAVGRSTRTGNRWLSIDGKVDASTGDDMPTQVLSGQLPVRIAGGAREVLVVGLASGVTAGAVLAEPGVTSLTVVELEPAVVRASRAFDDVSGAPLDDPRTTLLVDDARAVLARQDRRWDVIVSEPSNPWISGVSNLFTVEYWQLARSRLAPGGVMCQWVQLYGLGPEAFRALVRSFSEVFPEVWLFETIPGSDALLIGGVGALPDGLPLAPTLAPHQVRALGGLGWRNTDDHPRIEWEAPRWLHRATGPLNQALIEEAAAR